MTWFIEVLGITIFSLGLIFFIKPSLMRKTLKFWHKKKSLYFGAALNLIIGVIFIANASNCRIPWFIIFLGIAGLLKAIIAPLIGHERILGLSLKYQRKPNKFLRKFAILIIIMGAGLILAV